MNSVRPSPLILLGVGGAGAALVRGICRASGCALRTLILDTDARSGAPGDMPFKLIGGNRLAGRGSGGQSALARTSFQDDPNLADLELEGVRTALVVTSLGGGTSNGVTSELLKHLRTLGITTVLFATTPFQFEGEERLTSAQTARAPLTQYADVSIFLPLDDLVQGAASETMRDALSHAVDTLASGVSLLERLLEKPGYIRLDAERLRAILTEGGLAHFAMASASGPSRVDEILRAFAENPLLKEIPERPAIRTMLVGVLAGDDLRLSEIASLTCGLQAAYGQKAKLELGTVNDEETFSGRLSVVVLLFEEGSSSRKKKALTRGTEYVLLSNNRFNKTDRTIWNNEDLDVPTYARRRLTLDR